MILNNNQVVNGWGPHGQVILQLLAARGPSSRERLHKLSGLHRNLVGDTVRRLMDDGLVRLGTPQVRGRGRPQTPMSLDPSRRSILGVALDPGSVSACRVNLLGQPIETPTVRTLDREKDPIEATASLIRGKADGASLAIGVSVTGVIDVERGVILESSALRGAPVDLRLLRDTAGSFPLILENDLHALAQHWRMHNNAEPHEDVLLVRLEDGAVGAAFVVRGQPHTGCVHAASEIGHTRLAIETRKCYCGRRGCLERIFDSGFARDQDESPHTLAERIATGGRFDPAMARILDLVGLGIANAVQLTKPHRLLLVSQYAKYRRFRERLLSAIRREMLASFRDRVRLEWWDGPTLDRAIVAAYPALALIFSEQSVEGVRVGRRSRNFDLSE